MELQRVADYIKLRNEKQSIISLVIGEDEENLDPLERIQEYKSGLI